MSKIFLKLSTILLFFFYLVPAENQLIETFKMMNAKRNLQKKVRGYLKNNPIGSELESFMQRFKNGGPERRKRSDKIDPNSMFVIQNGKIVPLKNVNGIFDQKSSRNANGFTVLPLVVPIGVTKSNHGNDNDLKSNLSTHLDKHVSFNSKINETFTSPEDFIVTPLMEDPNNLIDMLYETNSLLAPDITPSPSIRDFNLKPNFFKNRQVKLEEPAILNSEDRNSDDTNTLHKILNDVEGLMAWKSQGLKREGVLCSVNGTWVTEAGGMLLDINFKEQSKSKFRINLLEQEPSLEGFLCNGNWTVVGAIPFPHSSVIVILATHIKDKHVATFIGECRICEGMETITGSWLLARSSKNCKDQKTAHKVLSDAWRRENVRSLQKEHLEELQRKT